MTSPSIACQQLVEMVTDYLEGCLTAEDMAAVQRHLQACADCSGYLTQMRRVITLTGAVFDDRTGMLPAGMLDGLTQAFTKRLPSAW